MKSLDILYSDPSGICHRKSALVDDNGDIWYGGQKLQPTAVRIIKGWGRLDGRCIEWQVDRDARWSVLVPTPEET